MNRVTQNILVVNSGSSSLKLSLFRADERLDAHLSGLNSEEIRLNVTSDRGNETVALTKHWNIEEGLRFLFDLLAEKYGFVKEEITAIGHRVVHGGNLYFASTSIDKKFLKDFSGLTELAPLHNAPCLAGINGCLSYFGSDILQVAVFDTAFYRDLPPIAAQYAIPYEMATKYAIRRYGFHGISHAFLWNAYAKEKVEASANARVITMHLGSGCSMTAIRGGRPIDTSMGFTPSEGLVMSTRAGDVDASLVEFLGRRESKSASEIMELLNRKSGLLGVSGVSADMSVLLSVCDENAQARLAIELFCYRVIKYLGAYIASLGGVDALIFSAGIGENSPRIREMIILGMEWFGVKMDSVANRQAVQLEPGDVKKISAVDSSVEVYVMATDENAFIAQEAMSLLK